MNKLGRAVRDIHVSDNVDSARAEKDGIHPLSCVLVTFLYLLLVLSFPNNDLAGLAGMILYLLIHSVWHEISVRTMLQRMWPVLLLTAAAGIANPVMDRRVYAVFGDVTVTYGMISMATLMIKGLFCVTASYILAVTVGIGQICHVLYLVHVPQEVVTVIMLMHRYLIVLIKEVERMQQAYSLRAPCQRGLNFRAWGSFVGLLLLRSMDRAEEVYESMKMRGFHGRIQDSFLHSNKMASILYVLLWGLFLFILRIFPVFQIVGNLF